MTYLLFHIWYIEINVVSLHSETLNYSIMKKTLASYKDEQTTIEMVKQVTDTMDGRVTSYFVIQDANTENAHCRRCDNLLDARDEFQSWIKYHFTNL